MLTFDATALARAAASVRGACYLVEIDFASGTQRATNYSTDLTSGGNTYTRLGTNLQISALTESEDAAGQKIEISVSVADTSKLAMAVGPASEYRKKAVRIYLQLLDEVGNPAGAAVKRFAGYIDAVSIERKQPNKKGDAENLGGTIKIRCSRAGQARSRHADGLRLTHAQQQVAYAGDNGYDGVATLVEKPTLWLSRRFQESGVQ